MVGSRELRSREVLAEAEKLRIPKSSQVLRIKIIVHYCTATSRFGDLLSFFSLANSLVLGRIVDILQHAASFGKNHPDGTDLVHLLVGVFASMENAGLLEA